MNAWTTSGTVMIFYLAALQSIPDDVYEAAALDNTGAWRTFWKITFPLLRPAHFFCLVVFGIGALKLFDQPFLIAGGASGAPNYSTMYPILYIYNAAFGVLDFGLAAAAGVVYFVIIFGLTVVAAPHGRQAGGRMTLQTSVASAEPYIPGRARSEVVAKVLLYGLYLADRAVFFVPFLWTLTTSFKTIPDSVNVTFFPHPWTTEAWRTIWNGLRLPDLHQEQPLPVRRVIVTCNLFLSALGGYAFARLGSPAASSCSCSCWGRSWCPTSCA